MTRHDSEILLYQTDNSTTRVEVRMAGETVWLNQNQMADLFLTTKQNVGQHIRNVFAEGELPHESASMNMVYIINGLEGVIQQGSTDHE